MSTALIRGLTDKTDTSTSITLRLETLRPVGPKSHGNLDDVIRQNE